MKNRTEMFDKYISTHFSSNVDFSDAKLCLEYTSFDVNIEKYLGIKSDLRILEIGFGTGYFVKYLIDKGHHNFDAIEISKEEYEFVRHNISENVLLVEDTGAFLRKHANAYDVVVLLDVLEHIPKTEVVDLLKDVRTSLKEHGKVFIRVPNAANPLNIQILFDDFTHETYFTGRSLKQVSLMAGYSTVEINAWTEVDASLVSKIANPFSKLLGKIIQLFMLTSRLYINTSNPMSRNISCVCIK